MVDEHSHAEPYHHDESDAAPSTAAVGGHPIHPMLVLFPVAFLIGALATDIAYASVLDPMWASFSFWLIAAGLVMGVLAAIVGAVDFWTIDRARQGTDGWMHFIGNGVVLVLAAVSLGFRWVQPVDFVVPWGLVLSTVITVLLLITGWYGGELSYRHRIGVAPQRPHPSSIRIIRAGEEPEQRRRSA
ncbi:MAG: DUF2231 domain-containing protein [Phycisphaeraceae bacterium]